MVIRVDHTTVQKQYTQGGTMVSGIAVVGGECPEHADCYVEEDEPVLLRHKAVATDEETGQRYVDLTVAEWGCQRGG